MSVIEIDDLSIRTEGFDLGPLDLRIDAGAYCVLLGPSGSGKTLLLEWIGGFRGAASGQLRIAGHDVTHAAPSRRDLAIVFQEAALFPHLSVQENIAFPLKMRTVPPLERERRTAEAATLLRVQHRLTASPRTLSGGEARRVALARALAVPRPVLLLDEPLTAVDPGLHRDLILLLGELHRRLDLTVIHVTHSLVEARNLATHVGVLIEGRLAQYGEANAVFERPADAGVARSLGLSNYLEGSLAETDGLFRVLHTEATLPVASASGAGQRARISGLTLADGSHEQTRPATIVGAAVSSSGGHSLHVRLDDVPIELEVPVLPGHEHRAGGSVDIDFANAHFRLF